MDFGVSRSCGIWAIRGGNNCRSLADWRKTIECLQLSQLNARLVRDKITNSKGKHGYKYGNICGLIHSEFIQSLTRDSELTQRSEQFGTRSFEVFESVARIRSLACHH